MTPSLQQKAREQGLLHIAWCLERYGRDTQEKRDRWREFEGSLLEEATDEWGPDKLSWWMENRDWVVEAIRLNPTNVSLLAQGSWWRNGFQRFASNTMREDELDDFWYEVGWHVVFGKQRDGGGPGTQEPWQGACFSGFLERFGRLPEEGEILSVESFGSGIWSGKRNRSGTFLRHGILRPVFCPFDRWTKRDEAAPRYRYYRQVPQQLIDGTPTGGMIWQGSVDGEFWLQVDPEDVPYHHKT